MSTRLHASAAAIAVLAAGCSTRDSSRSLEPNADPDVYLVVIGDFNAYEFTDGYVDLAGIIKGDFEPTDSLVCDTNVCVDLVDPDLTDQVLDDPRIDGAMVHRAARSVDAHRFIERLPQGYAEPVRERGANLSMGERQLISFARAVAFDPAVLVLDEATASVDPETERRIQAALGKMLVGRTSIIIAHRLATVRDVDRILVLHRGRLDEQGSHEQLIAREGGIYRALVQLQTEPT